MAKKSKSAKRNSSYKVKTGVKVGIFAGASAAIVGLAFAGAGVFNWIQTLGGEVDELPKDSDYVYSEPSTPSFKEPDNYGEYNPDETLPELEDTSTILPDLTPDENADELTELVNIFATLTNKSKEYINTVTGAEPTNLTITALNSIKIDSANGTVSILGHLKNGAHYHNFIANISNGDTTLAIYNIDTASISASTLSQDLDEILNDENSHITFAIKNYIKLSNESEVIKAMLNSRLVTLQATNSTDEAAVAEIEYLTSLLEDSSKVKFSLVLNKRTETENPYVQPFTAIINTGKFTYQMDMSYQRTKILSDSASTAEIENYLDENMANFVVTALPNAEINNALYAINTTAEIKQATEEATASK